MELDFTALKKALASLSRAVERSAGDEGDEELRDAVIQRFEYTFELCWKMLKRRLEMDLAVSSEVDAMSYKTLMRESAERGLIQDVIKWLIYREQRNITSHTYDLAKAQSVYKTAVEFVSDAQAFLHELEKRNHD